MNEGGEGDIFLSSHIFAILFNAGHHKRLWLLVNHPKYSFFSRKLLTLIRGGADVFVIHRYDTKKSKSTHHTLKKYP